MQTLMTPPRPLERPLWPHFKTVGLALAALAALGFAANAAQAQTTTTGYPGATGTKVSSPFMLSAGGNTLMFTSLSNLGGNGFYRIDAGPGSGLDYADGTELLETFDGTELSGPLQIDFSIPITQFSVYAQDYAYDDETFHYSFFQGANDVADFTVGPTTQSGPSGTADLLDGSFAPSFNRVVISSASSIRSNDFFVGPITFTSVPPVPEASSVVSFGLLCFCLGGVVIARKRQKTTV